MLFHEDKAFASVTITSLRVVMLKSWTACPIRQTMPTPIPLVPKSERVGEKKRGLGRDSFATMTS